MELEIKDAIAILEEAAKQNTGKNNIVCAIGEITIDETVYQIQVEFVSNKQCWVKPTEVRFKSVNMLPE